MRHFIGVAARVLITLLFLLPFASGTAQTAIPASNAATVQDSDSIINPIERIVEESDGNVEILISQDLMDKILKTPTSHKKSSTGTGRPAIRPGINKMSGYRIQVFADGRNQASLEARAKSRGAAISARLPKYRGQVYTFSSSPNWYTRVGNFRSQSEANEALVELRSNFPSFANEMRIVKCQIVVIK